ncbi:MAG: RluA family pseudouridine synthase [Clostridiales bacterium]|nr:RluA family pseudouridine synthase [Clostridiales bacterium]
MERYLTFEVPAEYDGRRLLEFLRGGARCSVSLVRSAKWTERGLLRNGDSVRTPDIVHTGDQISVIMPRQRAEDYLIAHPAMEVRVLYEDAYLLAVDKPAGLAVHPSPGHREVNLLGAATRFLADKGQPDRLHILGRLDRDTTGVILFARDAYTAARLTQKPPQKTYLAIACGHYAGEGTIDQPIRRQEGSIIAQEVGAGGKPAVTHWAALAGDGAMTLLRIRLDTGRTHQIRVHFAHLGTPLLGDSLYGTASGLIGRQALHCRTARLTHPVTCAHIHLSAPLPEDMAVLVKRLEGKGS